MTISPTLLSRLRELLGKIGDPGSTWSLADEIEANFLLQKMEPRKAPKKTWATRAAKPSRAESVAPLLAAARKRANGCCEACWYGPAVSLSMDHWRGGSGRRRQEESIWTVWMLCALCDRDRTQNKPSAAHWNNTFERHCIRYGYPFTPHIEHAPLNRGIAK